MKTYSIGRDPSNNIILSDPQQVTSRRHATLTVADNGKMTIVDQSTNGTYINGIRMSPNAPVPVTRDDKVSFAHVANLDWNMVPKQRNPVMMGIYAAVGVILLGLVVWLIVAMVHREDDDDTVVTPTEQTTETPAPEKTETPKEEEKQEEKKEDGSKSDDQSKKGDNQTKKGNSNRNTADDKQKSENTEKQPQEPNVDDPDLPL
ncbi:MAG: FHA domain-containing protein [Bacteroidales bacterium]|nr:FHA domain-containing protein [Bacteroidales bacterium]